MPDRLWHNFARNLGREHLIADPRFALYDARLANRDALQPIIHARMTQNTTAYWLQRLEEFDVHIALRIPERPAGHSDKIRPPKPGIRPLLARRFEA